ncbi:HTH-type transcriptional regulator SgrR [Aquitalea denitrificans]|uniref:HTH-type transcriptional regulator SgrR n=1 Tax=Aquitalea denitrificans TaxID=519081 RepID=UPI001357D217|nr:HTH-type transcriptional regulator SgrR [Aquitalea denitrificans]
MKISSFMHPKRLTQQYHRLYQHFSGQEVDTQLQQLADIACCTRRHMRNVLNGMQQQGWLEWQAQAGRGGRSRLRFCCKPENLRRDSAASLLGQGKVEQALEVLDHDKQALATILLQQLGQHWRNNRQVLSIPYYRALPSLYPGTDLRRSERHLVRQIHSGLTVMNEEKGEVEADVAHHWHQHSSLEWHFHLRPCVRWHDGRLLSVDDVKDSLLRLRQLPLFSHIQTVQALTPRCISIVLNEEDARLPTLLADSAALLLPSSHAQNPEFASHPIGCGPYKVNANDDLHLSLQAFDDYFGYRALLDEIDIWILPELGVEQRSEQQSTKGLEVQVSPVASAEQAYAMEAEQGCYFVLLDSRSALLRSQVLRQQLSHLLSPLLLIQHIPLDVRQYWTVASSLLPQWFHLRQQHEVVGMPVHGALSLNLAYPEDQPDYPAIAQAIQDCLAAAQIKVSCHSISFTDWQQGLGGFDMYLGSVNFTSDIDYAIPAWLLGTPLVRNAAFDAQNHQVTDLHSEWRRGVLDAGNLTAHVLSQHTLLPLFHNRLRLQVSDGMQDLKLNALGWFDFKSAWHR